MKSRKELKDEREAGTDTAVTPITKNQWIIIELLLDIRDLLKKGDK